MRASGEPWNDIIPSNTALCFTEPRTPYYEFIMSVEPTQIPQPLGDGLTKETAYSFPQARNSFEGVAMAYAFMQSRGPEYQRLKQFQHIDSTDEEIIEWWETSAGKFWFRYRTGE